MSLHTKIEWCDSTCNPTMGCNGCELWNRSAGIQHCYAGQLTDRYGGKNKGFPIAFEEPQLFPGRIEQALKWKDLTGTERPDKPWLNGMPRLIFVGDMGDTFTESLGDDYTWLADLVQQMSDSPHQWLMLTKRPERMARFSQQIGGLPANVWPGTTVTSMITLNRCRYLARVVGGGPKFVSAEPLIGRVSFRWAPWQFLSPIRTSDHLDGLRLFDWIITGGESGQNARPMHPHWVREIRDQCAEAGVPFFHKQNGEWQRCYRVGDADGCFIGHCWQREIPFNPGGPKFYTGIYPELYSEKQHLVLMKKVPKQTAGRRLDGVEHNGMPAMFSSAILR